MRLELAENQPPVLAELSNDLARTLAQARLADLSPTATHGQWAVRAGRYVGLAQLGDLELVIHPKTPIKHVLFMLGYATGDRGWQSDTVQADTVDDLVPAVADAYARSLTASLAHGVLQGYRETEDVLPLLRGRLREAEQIRRFGLITPLAVRFDEYTTDIAENRILAAAADRLLALRRVPAEVRRTLTRSRLRLADVQPIRAGQRLPAWQPNRLNQHYRPALRVAELVLSRMSITSSSGGTPVPGLLLDMPRIFEDFVCHACGDDIRTRGGRPQTQDGHYLDLASRLRIRPDLVWYRGKQPVAVIDAKYKVEGPKGYPDADIYQLLAYCTALGLDRGHLVYARGNAPERDHAIRNAGVTITQHALDLSGSPSAILSRVDELVDHIAPPIVGTGSVSA